MVVLRTLARFFALLLVCLIASCGPAGAPDESQDPFIAALHQAYEDGQTYEEIADRIEMRRFPGQPPYLNLYLTEPAPSESGEEGDDYAEYAFYARLMNDVEFIKALRDRNCQTIRERIGEPDAYRADGGYFAAFVLEEGICVARDPASAAELYLQYTAHSSAEPVALARLGNLYLKGDGVEKDPKRAEELFERAAIEGANMYWTAKGVIERGGLPPGNAEAVWGLSSMEMQMRFAGIFTGPWDLPAPLQAKIQWLDDLYTDGGKKIAEIAEDMMSEGGKYKKDVMKATSWMSTAGDFPGNDDYMFQSATWDMDPEICRLKQERVSGYDCDDDVRYGFWQMEQLALRGRPEAIGLVFGCYLASRRWDKTAWAWYQHVLSIQSSGSYLKSYYPAVAEARARLDEFEQRIVEAWARRKLDSPIRGYLPDVTEEISGNCPPDGGPFLINVKGRTSQR